MLVARLGRQAGALFSGTPGIPVAKSHSVLDIPPVHVGRILRPLSPDDDLLDEMIEARS